MRSSSCYCPRRPISLAGAIRSSGQALKRSARPASYVWVIRAQVDSCFSLVLATMLHLKPLSGFEAFSKIYVWAWVITLLSEFIQEQSYFLLPLQNDK